MTALLNADQAAAYLGGEPITVATVKKLARDKKLAHVRINRTVMFTVEGLDTYIAEHTIAVEENPWGLSDGALRNLRAGRRERPNGSAA